MKNKINYLQILLSILPFVFIFISSLYRPYDADLGWHLKYGEYFFKHGQILKENIFATEMSDFIWPNTSWGVDLIYYLAFSSGGFLGLTILGALVITLTFYFFSKAFQLDTWQKAIVFPMLVILEDPANQISFRGQILSMMLLGLLAWILMHYQRAKKRKTLFLLIPLFLFWANLHGQFILGLGILILWMFFYFVSLFVEKLDSFRFKSLISEIKLFLKTNFSEIKFFILILLLTLLATLIHPFGFGIYKVAFSHFSNPDLYYIMEYLPFDELSQPWWNMMVFGIGLFLGILYLIFSGKFKSQIPFIGVVSVLYGLSWWVKRYTWSMYYLGIPLLKPLADFVRPDKEKSVQYASLILFAFYIISAIYVKLPLTQFLQMNWEIYCETYNTCSPKSVEFIRDNNLHENLYSLYGWGGYMIWNYPEVKPSIDGRMHLWRDDQGYSAFSDYYAYEQNWNDINNSKYGTVLMSKEKPIYDRLNELVEVGKWEKPFEDDFAGVFIRNKEATESSEFILR